jgi:hypothetical protein
VPPVRLLPQLLHVEAVDHAVNDHQHLRLFILAVDSLRYCDEPDIGKLEPLLDVEFVGGITP